MPRDIRLGRWPLDLIAGADSAAQRLRIRLGTHLGEWPLDDGVGLPFIAWGDTLPPPLIQIRDYVVFEIEDTPGCRSLGVSTSFNASTGAVTVNARARYAPEGADGNVLEITVLFGALVETFSRVVVLPMA